MFSLACYDVLSACGRILIAYADHVRFVALFEDDWIRQSLIMYDLSHIVYVMSHFLYGLSQFFEDDWIRQSLFSKFSKSNSLEFNKIL